MPAALSSTEIDYRINGIIASMRYRTEAERIEEIFLAMDAENDRQDALNRLQNQARLNRQN